MRLFVFAMFIAASTVLTQHARAEGLPKIEIPSSDSQELFMIRDEKRVNKMELAGVGSTDISSFADMPVQIGVTSRLRHMALQGVLSYTDYYISIAQLRSRFKNANSFFTVTFEDIHNYESIVSDLQKMRIGGLDDLSVRVLALAIYEHYQDKYITPEFADQALKGFTKHH